VNGFKTHWRHFWAKDASMWTILSKFTIHTTKWPVQTQTHRKTQKHTEHKDATDIQNELFVLFSAFSFFYDFLNDFLVRLEEMIEIITNKAEFEKVYIIFVVYKYELTSMTTGSATNVFKSFIITSKRKFVNCYLHLLCTCCGSTIL